MSTPVATLPIGEVFLAALRAVVTVALILAVGVVGTYLKTLNADMMRSLAKVTGSIFLPAILFSRFASGITQERLLSSWPLVVAGLGFQCVNFVLAWIAERLIGVEPWFRRWFIVMLVFPNLVAIPFVIVKSICNQVEYADASAMSLPNFNASNPVILSPLECFDSASVNIFLYGTSQMLVLFGGVAHYCAISPEERDRQIEARKEQSKSMDRADSTSEEDMIQEGDNEDGMTLEIATGLESEPNSTSPPSPASSSDLSQQEGTKNSKWGLVKQILLRPPIIAQVLGITVGLIPALRDITYGSSTSELAPVVASVDILAEAAIPVANIILAGNLGSIVTQVGGLRHILNSEKTGLRKRTVLSAMILKMVVLPALNFAVVYAIDEAGILPDDNLLKLILYLEASTPTANMISVLAQILDQPIAAEAIALVSLLQYCIALPCITVFVAFSLILTT